MNSSTMDGCLFIVTFAPFGEQCFSRISIRPDYCQGSSGNKREKNAYYHIQTSFQFRYVVYKTWGQIHLYLKVLKYFLKYLYLMFGN